MLIKMHKINKDNLIRSNKVLEHFQQYHLVVVEVVVEWECKEVWKLQQLLEMEKELLLLKLL